MHRESADAVVTLPATTGDVSELLNSCHKQEKEVARDMLQIILSSLRFLARQGWLYVVTAVMQNLTCFNYTAKKLLLN